jgi:hypothetical protein
VQSQFRFTWGLEKVLVKVPGGFGAEPSQAQQCFREGSGEGLKGFGVEPGQVQQVVPALCFAARVRKTCKHASLHIG